MTAFDCTITPSARISAGVSAATGNARQSHTILPGTTIRGALAAAWWRDRRPDFTSDDAAQRALDTLFERSLIVCQAVPRGAQLVGCSQYWSKYPSHGTEPERHDEALQALGDPDFLRKPNESGWATGTGWTSGPARTVSRVSVRLDNDGRAEEGALFSRQSIEPTVPGPDPDRPEQLVLDSRIVLRPGARLDPADAAWLAGPIRVRIGGRRTVLGAASMQCRAAPSDAGRVPADADGATSRPRPDGRAAIRLTSPAILVDDFGAPTMNPTGELSRLLGGPASSDDAPSPAGEGRAVTWSGSGPGPWR